MTILAGNMKALALVGGAVLVALSASLLVRKFCKPQPGKPLKAEINDWEAEGGNVEQPPISVGT